MSNNKRRDAQNINVTSYGQTGGVTAGQVVYESPQRSLVGRTVQASIASKLKGRDVGPVRIDAINADGEAQQFTDELFRVVTSDLGWPVTSMPNTVMVPGVLRGLRVHSVADQSDHDDPLRAFAEWLHAEGMRVELVTDASMNKIEVGVV